MFHFDFFNLRIYRSVNCPLGVSSGNMTSTICPFFCVFGFMRVALRGNGQAARVFLLAVLFAAHPPVA
jgi:hypothetical protein